LELEAFVFIQQARRQTMATLFIGGKLLRGSRQQMLFPSAALSCEKANRQSPQALPICNLNHISFVHGQSARGGHFKSFVLRTQ